MRAWSNIVTISCLIIVAVVEAWQQALSGAPSVAAILPRLNGMWNFLPVVLLVIAGVSWLVGHVKPKHKEQTVGVMPKEELLRKEWHELEQRFTNGKFHPQTYFQWQRLNREPELRWKVIGCGPTAEVETKALIVLMDESGNLLLRTPYFVEKYLYIAKVADAGFRWAQAMCDLLDEDMPVASYGETQGGYHEQIGVVRDVVPKMALACQMLAAKAVATPQ